MIAAIYARKSTDQSGVSEDEKSVARQIEHGRAYAASKGWEVGPVFEDDGISGAEFERRPGFLRLMTAIEARPCPFQFLIMSEDSRLGRDQIRTAYALQQIVDAGVRVFFYLDDRERKLDNATDKMVLAVLAGAAELEREKAKQRTHDAMKQRARKGSVTGGRLFGYDNVTGADGTVTRVINEAQAATVRRIYEWYADGLGFKRIAEQLNLEGARGPRATPWQHTAIRELLHNPTFGGIIVWNRTKRIARGGKTNVKVRRADAELVTVRQPELQIVPDELLARVKAKRDANGAAFARGAGGRLVGKPAVRDLESKHLLVGFMKCARCGAHMIASPRSNKQGAKVYGYYRCSAASNMGKAVCTAPSIRSDRIEPAVLSAIQGTLGTQKLNEVLDAVMTEAKGRDRSTDLEARLAAIQAELTKAANARQNLLRTIESATEDVPAFLIGRARELEAQEKRLRGELDTLTRASQQSAEAALSQVRGRVEVLRKMLAAPVAQARSALRRLGVQVTLELEAIEPWVTHAHYTIAGTFKGLAEGWSTYAYAEEPAEGAAAPPTTGGSECVLPRWCREGGLRDAIRSRSRGSSPPNRARRTIEDCSLTLGARSIE